MFGDRSWPAAAAAAGLVALAVLIGCGREESVASKSAAAFQEAQKEGKTFAGAGHDHGAGQAHDTHGAAGPAPAQGGEHHHSTAPEADHSAMGHGGGHSAEGHATAQHEGHASPSAGHGHTGHPQPTAPGHDHGAVQPAAPGHEHAGHPAPGGGTPSRPVADLPAQPASILRPDPLDAPAATSVLDAQRAGEMNQAMNGAHGGHGGHGAGTYRHVDAGRNDDGAAGEETVLYVCPMHPEVTSKTPGSCPKCGMTLVERREE